MVVIRFCHATDEKEQWKWPARGTPSVLAWKAWSKSMAGHPEAGGICADESMMSQTTS